MRTMQDLIDDLRRRQAQAFLGGGAARQDKQREAGKLTALIAGYSALRPLTPGEEAAWPALRRAAALRFWLLRLDARQHPRPGAVVTIKDPDHFGQLLQRLCLAQESVHR